MKYEFVSDVPLPKKNLKKLGLLLIIHWFADELKCHFTDVIYAVLQSMCQSFTCLLWILSELGALKNGVPLPTISSKLCLASHFSNVVQLYLYFMVSTLIFSMKGPISIIWDLFHDKNVKIWSFYEFPSVTGHVKLVFFVPNMFEWK